MESGNVDTEISYGINNKKIVALLEMLTINKEIKALRNKAFLKKDYHLEINTIINEIIENELNNRERNYLNGILDNV